MWKRDELLGAFRDDRGPTDDAVERMHRRLRELGPVQEGAQVIELAPSRRTSRRVRIAVAVGALAAAAVLGWWIRGVTLTPAPAVHGSVAEDRVEEDDASAAAQIVDDRVRTREAVPPAPAAQPAAIEPAPPQEPVAAPQRPRSRSAPARAPATPTMDEAPDAIEPEPRRDTLAAEAAIIQRARVELSRGRPQKALAILADHRAQFPAAALLEEANAVRTMAQCRIDTADAAELGAAFVARFPKSLFRNQVEAACSKPAAE